MTAPSSDPSTFPRSRAVLEQGIAEGLHLGASKFSVQSDPVPG